MGLMGGKLDPSPWMLLAGVGGVCKEGLSDASIADSITLGARDELALERDNTVSEPVLILKRDGPFLRVSHLRERDGKREPRREVMPASGESLPRRLL